MMLTLAALAVAAALVYGIFAGRHDAPPTGAVIAAKTWVERTLGLKRQWRREFHGDTAGLEPVPCPENALVIVAGGQSNAANALSDPVDADPAIPAYMAYHGQCYRISDPVLGATGKRGSLWTALAQALAVELDRPVVVIGAAVAATSYDSWLDRRSGYLDRLEAAVSAAAGIGLTPDLVLWHQGESDAHRQAEAAAFEPSIQALVERIQALPPMQDADFILFRASRCTGARANGNAPLVTAQTRVAERLRKVHVGPNTDQLGARHRYDGCHFNARGRDQIVEMALELSVSILAPRLAQD